MEDNRTVTADSGADISQSEVGTTNKASRATEVTVNSQNLTGSDPTSSVSTVDVVSDDDVEVVEEFREHNEALRQRWLECTRRIKEAQASGDATAEARAREDRDRVGNEFVQKNTRLAVRNASAFLIKDQESSKDHLQAAMLGLWEAFVGLDASKVDDVLVDDEGRVHAAAGWDPDKGTFATFAGSYISGRTRRSVKTVESTYTGMSYNTWSDKPKVDRARRELSDSLGRTPTLAEIAAKAGVTVATVRACSTATPVSLQALLSDDGSTTLGDMLADTAGDDTGTAVPMVAEKELIARARQMSMLDLMVLLLRTGITGRPALTVNRAADKLCIGRGAAQLAIKRAQAALLPERAIPETVVCEPCATRYEYDVDNEPALVLTEFDVPTDVDDLTVSQYQRLMAAWTERVNEAHQAEIDAHDQAVIAFRAKARDAAAAFTTKHRRHLGAGVVENDLAALLTADAG